jgi:peptidyl-prolyl cis-trans isomerase SurA
MTCRFFIAAFLLLNASSLWAAQVLDRTLASVNGQIILQSDVDDEIRYSAFMSGGALNLNSPDEQRAALDRLIDRELVREQMRSGDIKPTSAEEIEKQLEQLRAEYGGSGNPQSWNAALSKYGIAEEGLRARIASELEQLRFVDARLRPGIQIEAADVEKYYKEQFLPKLVPSGAPQPTMAEAAPKIREILTQQKMNQALNTWLEGLRSQAQIKVLTPNPENSTGQTS